MMRPSRLSVVHGGLVVFAVLLVIKTAVVQLVQGRQWARLAARQHYADNSLPAPRGDVLDASGIPLARSQERVRLAIAPREVGDRRKLQRALEKLGVNSAVVRRAVNPRLAWVELKGAYPPSDVAGLRRMTGVHTTPVGERVYVVSEGARKLIGRTNGLGEPVDGLELALDSLLRGTSGRSSAFRGAKGDTYESPDPATQSARPGHTVTLTIDYRLQDICDRALSEATTSSGADGGDIVLLDPSRGEVRCMASRRRGIPGAALTSITEPFEPGSTLKPLFAGAMIDLGVAHATDEVDTHEGTLLVSGRRITDVHKSKRLSLADVIRFSSNVGIVEFAQRLSNRQMFEVLRDFGFGTPTGLPYPSEAAGRLREPRSWSNQSHASLAIGYEVSVTPLQLVTAYAAIANGGRLLQPTIIRAVHDADGREVFVATPRTVRRVLTVETARRLRDILQSVVDSGTATDASLATFNFGGKSGTARRTSDGRYGAGLYTATFVGLWPSADPQYVILAKLDNPKGTYYGGKTAAPMAKAVIEMALAAPDVQLDRGNLAGQRSRVPSPGATPRQEPVVAGGDVGADASRTGAESIVAGTPLIDTVPEAVERAVVRFDVGRAPRDPAVADSLAVVPDVRGLPLRVALRELHRAGVRVVVGGRGVGATVPPAGTVTRRGALVRYLPS